MQSGQLRFASVFALSALSALAAVTVACSSTPTNNGFGTDPANGGPGGTDDGGVGDPNNPIVGANGDAMPGPAVCAPSAGNYEVPMNGCDDDNDGTIDNVPSCDTGLAVGGNADDFAKSLGLCQKASGATDPKWGVVSAAYTRGYNQPTAPADGQHGILPKFGAVVKPREGATLGVLSSGWAREFNGDTGDTSTSFKGTHTQITSAGAVPPGFPKASGTCVLDTKVKDVASLKVQIKVPTNAKGIAFDFNFQSGEWPEWVCTKFNDGFIAYLTSSALPGGKADNISFDSMGNTVSVNNGFF
ncbi:MAG: choice-of-anchor L domain-containing protein, partial [Polyangiaceae bacterium]